MRIKPILIFPLALALTGCGQEAQTDRQAAPKPEPLQQKQSAAPEPVAEPSAPPPAGQNTAMMDKAKEIYQSTKEKSGEMTEAVVDKSREIYQSTKEKSGEITETAVEKSKAAWDKTRETAGEIVDKSKAYGSNAVDKSKEMYESAKEKAGELIDKAMESSAQPPPPAESKER